MRYYDLIETPNTGKTFLEGGANRLPSDDARVTIYFQKVDLVRFDRYFDIEGYPQIKEYELQEDGTRYNHYLDEPIEDIYQIDTEKTKVDLKAEKIQEIKNTTDAYASVLYDGITYNGGAESAGAISDAVSLARLRTDTTVGIWDINDKTTLLSIDIAEALAATIATQYSDIMYARQARITSVNELVFGSFANITEFTIAVNAI